MGDFYDVTPDESDVPKVGVEGDEKHNGLSNGAEFEKGGKDKALFLNGLYNPEDEKGGVANGHGAVDSEEVNTVIASPAPRRKMVGTLEIFRFADKKDRAMMVLGTLCALAQGTAMPIVFVVFGNMTDMFVDNAELSAYIDSILPNLTVCNPNVTYDWVVSNQEELTACLINNNMTDILDELNRLYQGSLLDQMKEISLIYVYLGIAVIICGYIEMACWQMAAANQCQRIRSHLLKSILSQDIGWFDTHEIGELHSRLVDDVEQIEAGIGDKMALFFQYFCAFIAGFLIGFVKGWQLTLVMLSVTPLLAVSAAVVNKLAAIMSRKEQDAYAKAGSVAEEVLGAIRTVTMFGGQDKECTRYNDRLVPSRKFGIRKGWVTGVGIGTVYFLLFSSYSLAFWYGSDLVRNDPAYSAGVLTTVFFAIIVGSFSLGNSAPQIQDFANARGAAYEVFRLIDLESAIDNNSSEGKKPEKVRGDIEFKNVKFSYPSRKEVPVLQDMSFKVNVGQTCALVGSSGCGKSTTVQILQRFYDIAEGKVLIDGLSIGEWNLDYLRRQIGVVSQEPVLFATTIAENIKYGRQDATMDDVINASKKANAHEFISKLPDKYDTMVGERGAQLSGGQKQRIAIARALVRDPKILLLDEATSALDTQSESTVQIALDQARQGRTTIIIAHRLSTVRTADYILGVAEGRVVEQGNHEQLMRLGKLYYNLVTSQTSVEKEAKEPEDFIPTGDYIFSRQLSTVSNKSTKSTGADVLKIAKAKEADNVDMMRLMRMNKPEWIFILVAAVMATINGCVQPCFAFVFAEILSVFSIQDLTVQKQKTDFLSAMFLVIAVVASISAAIMHGMFGYTGENLTFRLRKMVFKILLQQEIGYFDDPANTTGALCSRLSSDASLVRGAAGSRIGYLIQGMAAIGLGLIIGFVYSWQLTLVVLCFAPLTLMSGFVQSKVVRRGGVTDKKMENASSIAIEAIENIRTVTSLSLQQLSLKKYCDEMTFVYKGKKRSAHVISIAYAISQSVTFFADAACFSFGAYLIVNAGLQYDDMFKVFLAVILGAQAAGRATSFAPDYGKAKSAAARLFVLFDRVPDIDNSSEAGTKLDKMIGKMDFSQIEFFYPSRPKVKVLRGVDFTVEPGSRVALVGSSGCGKSTTMQLLQRFYDPINGCIKVDGVRIDSLNLPWWRNQLGLVSQEPILFDCSIRENIAYGDNSRDVPIEEITEAARKANIHNFISNLPQGYETSAGDKGAQLSGGQKQRIAIARALVRNPKILLLDEATSALDMESEKIVQDALDKAQEGRTSLVIAHRLSTIQNSDKIFVFHNGKIVESGTHEELLSSQGLYHKLYTVSSITSSI